MVEQNENFLIGAKEICAYVGGISYSTLMIWQQRQGFPMQKIGDIWRSDKKQIDDWHRKNTQKALGLTKKQGPAVKQRKKKRK